MASHQLRLTPSPDAAIKELQGKPADDWDRLKPELKAQGCRAGGSSEVEQETQCTRNLEDSLLVEDT